MSPATSTTLLHLSCAVLLATACDGASSAPAPRTNVLLITLDTTRADHLGCYGYPQPTSPHIDRLAGESTLFTHALSTASWTLPAHASLFTGKFTTSHGARYDAEGPLKLTSGIEGPKAWDDYRARGLAAGEHTLAGVLTAAGFRTGAVVGGPWMKRVFGLDAGFEHYDDDQVHSVSGRLASEVTDAALGWLDSKDDRPFFLFLNYYDAHTPFHAPAPRTFMFLPPELRNQRGLQDRASWVYLYDAEISYVDEQLGRLLRGMRAAGTYDDTLIVVTADHGELFGEICDGDRHWGHGEFLSPFELHVPLIVKYPRGEVAPGRDDEPMQSVDVMPMILERLGLPVPAGVQGRRAGQEHPIVAEVYPLARFAKTGDWRMLVEGDLKYLWNSQGRDALYDLAQDPLEQHDLSAERPDTMRAMGERLDAYLAGLPRPGAAGPEQEVDAGTAEALQQLGYTGDEPAQPEDG